MSDWRQDRRVANLKQLTRLGVADGPGFQAKSHEWAEVVSEIRAVPSLAGRVRSTPYARWQRFIQPRCSLSNVEREERGGVDPGGADHDAEVQMRSGGADRAEGPATIDHLTDGDSDRVEVEVEHV
jgi:hypothetical protein